ncbi:MAG: MFS transporter [Pseudomonadota bacterium]
MSDSAAPTTGSAPVPLRPLTQVQMYVIAFALISMGVGMTVSFVVASPLAREAGLSELQVAGILTLSAFFYAALTPLWGRIANRVGRKRVMVFSLAAMGATNALFILGLSAAMQGAVTGLSAFLLLAVIRLSFGILAPGLQPASFSAITDATTPINRAAGMGLLGAAMSIGSILGPAGAAALASVGPLAPLWGSVLFSWFAALVIAFALPPTRKTSATSAPPPLLRIRDARVLPHLTFLFVYFVAVGSIQQTLAWLVQDRFALGQAEAVQAAGITFAAMAVTLVAVQFGYVNRRKPDPQMMLTAGLAFVAVGYALSVLHLPFWGLCTTFSIVGIGAALVVPAANALATLAVTPAEQGAAASLVAAAPPAGFIIGPLLGAVLYAVHADLPLIVSAAVMAGLWVYALTALRQSRVTPAA